MTKFQDPVTLTMTMADLAAIVTEQVCTFNALANLEVGAVRSNGTGSFILSLVPKQPPKPVARVPK